MTPTEISIQLTDEEMAVYLPFHNACDERAQGYAEGMAAAKRLLVQKILAARKPAEPAKEQ